MSLSIHRGIWERHLALALVAASTLVATGCGPGEPGELSDESEAALSSPTISVFPVRGRHNLGYDSTAGNASLWSCQDAHSNSDYVRGDHIGNDIWATRGTPVAATVDGTLTAETGWSNYSGNKVTLKDSRGWYHFFCHLDHLASGIRGGGHVKAGQIIGYVGNTGTASNGVVHLHYSLYPSNNYNAGVDPWPYLHKVEHDTCSAVSTPPAQSKYWVNTFASARGYAQATTNSVARGTLNAGTNYVFCKKQGSEVRVGSAYNHYWLLTDLDHVYAGQSGRAYVSAYFLKGYGNDVAKDTSGRVIPDCP